MTEMNPIPRECGPTLERIQSVMDRIHPESILAADPHPESCAACRERVTAARLMLVTFAEPKLRAPSLGFTIAVLEGVKRDRIARARLRGRVLAASFAAAGIGLALIWGFLADSKNYANRPVPTPHPSPLLLDPKPPQPIRMNEQLARAGEALKQSSRTITEPAASAPRVFAALTDSFLKAPTAPVGVDLGPAEKSLTEIPDAARAGLEPVTGTAQKAWNRLLRDVSAMQPKVKS
jgi:hypothetical protein